MISIMVVQEITHKGYYSRGYLPHFDDAEKTQFITFHLADSMPRSVCERWREELSEKPKNEADIELRRRMERYLDAGSGSCILREKRYSEVVADSLQKDDGIHYSLLAYTIMPNHVHVLIRQNEGSQLPMVVRRWKGGSSRQINVLRQSTEKVWQFDYFDRYIRDERHFGKVLQYIHMNPVWAKLAKTPEDWERTYVHKDPYKLLERGL